MSATIVDLSAYGDVKGRDTYSRNTFQSVKGDGVNANSVTQGFYGIPSTTEVEYEMARMTVTEGSFDDEIGTITFGIRDGSALNDVLSINNLASEITTTTFTMNTTDVYATGIMNVGTVQQNDDTERARIELVSDPTNPNINFVLGELDATPSMPLILSEDTVAITGDLTIDGVDVLTIINDANPWETSGTVTQLKTSFDTVEINVVNAYSTSVALDVNGTIRVRGNDIFFYDEPNSSFYSALSFDTTSNEFNIRSSRAGDSLILSTTDGNDSTYLNRFTLDDGAGTTNATFTNVNVGIGATPSGSYSLEVTGNANFTTGVLSGGDIDLSGNNLLNVTQIDSSDAVDLTEQARIELTSDLTSPQVEIQLGDLTAPTAVATFTETLTTVSTPTTFSDNVIITGDLTVQGTQVIFNTTTVEVEDISIEMGSVATLANDIDGGGIILGPSVTDVTIPSILYSTASGIWASSIGFSIPTTASLTVGSNTEVTDGEVALNTDSAFVYFGANKQWRMGITNDTDGDHFQIAHDDLGTQTTWEVKMDVLQ